MTWARKYRYLGSSQNPVPPCLLFAVLFDLFVLPKRIALVEINLSDKIDPKSIPIVAEHADGVQEVEPGVHILLGIGVVKVFCVRLHLLFARGERKARDYCCGSEEMEAHLGIALLDSGHWHTCLRLNLWMAHSSLLAGGIVRVCLALGWLGTSVHCRKRESGDVTGPNQNIFRQMSIQPTRLTTPIIPFSGVYAAFLGGSRGGITTKQVRELWSDSTIPLGRGRTKSSILGALRCVSGGVGRALKRGVATKQFSVRARTI